MKRIVILFLVFFLLESCVENLGSVVIGRWSVSNQTNETLYLISLKSVDMKIVAKDTICWTVHCCSEDAKDSYSSDFSDMYSLEYGRYTDITLLDSNRQEIERWSIYDSIIDEHHIMNEAAWSTCEESNGYHSRRKEWLYTISEEDLARMRNDNNGY